MTPFLDKASFIGYCVCMLIILTAGLAGNVLTILVLRKRHHRAKPLTPLVVNLSVADIIICVLGYTIAVTNNIAGFSLNINSTLCSWLAFINCFIGIASVGTLTSISYLLFKKSRNIHPLAKSHRDRGSHLRGVLISIWIYAFILAAPPLFGWNQFVPMSSQISCHPDWESQEPKHLSYIAFLVVFGFFMPLGVISFCHASLYRCLKSACSSTIAPATNRRKKVESWRKTMRMTCIVVFMFFVSWSPYCVVSLLGTVTRSHVMHPATSLVPELMAKASVVYNPLVYTAIDRRFRMTIAQLFTTAFGKSGRVQT